MRTSVTLPYTPSFWPVHVFNKYLSNELEIDLEKKYCALLSIRCLLCSQQNHYIRDIYILGNTFFKSRLLT